MKHAMLIALPIMVQNGITNFVSMLDNIMIGRIGTEQMTAAAIVNQLMFVFNLCIFGGLSGIGIFTAQYAGKKDIEGVRNTFRLSFLLAMLMTVIGTAVFLLHGPSLVNLYLHDDASAADLAATLQYAMQYMHLILVSLGAFALTQVYAGVLRADGETSAPMRAGTLAVFVNLIGNYLLIYGKAGLPALGVAGAAIATVVSRFVELVYITVWAHRHKIEHPYIDMAYASMRVPKELFLQCLLKGSPLLLNEALWSSGEAILQQNFSLRGVSVVAAMNISMTICNVFNIGFMSLGQAIGILVGQELGKGNTETVKKQANDLSLLSVILCILIGAVLYAVAPAFPKIYAADAEIRSLAAGLIRVSAVMMPLYAYGNASYFTIRSGGKTMITFIFDSGFTWAASIPAAWVLVRHTALPILIVYAMVQGLNLVKDIIGFVLVQRGNWIVDLTALTE